MRSRASICILSAGVLAPAALAQNDECTTAMAVGPGVYAFDTTAATLSAQPWPCAGGGGPDLWYSVTATNDETTFAFLTCGSGFDTCLEVFDGSCAALNSVRCDDDTCSLQSQVWILLDAGETAYVRVGGFNGLTGPGTLEVTEVTPPPPAGSASAWLNAVATGTPAVYTNTLLPEPIIDDIGMPGGATGVTYEFIVYGDNTGTSSALMGNLGGGIGSSAALKFEQWNDTLQYGVTAYGVADYLFPGGNNTEHQDIQIVYVADVQSGSTELFIDGVSFGTAPFAPLLQSMQGIGMTYRPSGDFIDIMYNGRIRCVAVYDAILGMQEITDHRDAYFSGNLGTRYCTPAVANSTGSPATMVASGSLSVATNMLTLECHDMPMSSFGYFLTSRTQGMVNQPGGSQGVLCLGGAIGRFVGPGQVQNSGAGGAIFLLIDLDRHPTPTGLVQVQAGDIWSFTCWFRDAIAGQATSNFADGLELQFLP